MEKEKKGLGRRILLMSMLSLISLFGMSISTFAEEDEFQKMEERWKSQLVFEKESPENESLRAYIEALSKEAENLYQTLDQSPDRTYLWPLESGNTSSADLTTQFTKLQKLTYAYKTKGTTLYQQPEVAAAIKEGIDFMITKKGYDGKKYYGNWWDWQIGIPQKFVNILLLLHQELSSEKIQQYTAILNQYVPDLFQQLYTKPQDSFVDLAFIPNFSTTGANRTDLSLTVLGVGILQKDATKIHQAVNGIKDVFQLVTSGDGFYADGSFIQHNDIPYTGSYGNVLIKGVGQIFTIVDGTSYAAASDDIHAFVENVEKAFIPLIYQGEMLPMVNGRAISRAPSKTKVGYGSSTMYNLLIVSKFAPEDKQKELKEAVKYWMQLNPSYYITNVRDYNDLVMTLSLLEDQTILGKDLPFIGTKMYHKMDRFVQRTSKYMVGISMYSNRISSFEAGNKENKRGWHTSDGMVYLYNEDDVQFGKSYWPTVDPYRLPGTTVDTVPLKDEISSFTTVRSNEKAVGGVSNEGQAVVGMALNKTGTKNNGTVLPMDVKGKKSWFVLDDQLIALGSGITGNTNASIETIIDNRLLNDQFTYKVVTETGEITQPTEQSEKEWLLLQSSQPETSIGYYFPEKETVKVISEARQGNYREINESFPSDEVYHGSYRKFLINHGKHPINEAYAYVILPGVNEKGLKEYAEKEPVTILQNTPKIQAVKVKESGYLGINFWDNTGGELDGLKTDKPLSVLKKINEQEKSYTFADLAHTKTKITIELPNDFEAIQSMSEGITYDEQMGRFTIDFSQTSDTQKQIVVE